MLLRKSPPFSSGKVLTHEHEASRTSGQQRLHLISAVADSRVLRQNDPAVPSHLRQPDGIFRAHGETLIVCANVLSRRAQRFRHNAPAQIRAVKKTSRSGGESKLAPDRFFDLRAFAAILIRQRVHRISRFVTFG